MRDASEIGRSRVPQDKAGKAGRTGRAGRARTRTRTRDTNTRTCVAAASGGRGLPRERVVRVRQAVGAAGAAWICLVLSRDARRARPAVRPREACHASTVSRRVAARGCLCVSGTALTGAGGRSACCGRVLALPAVGAGSAACRFLVLARNARRARPAVWSGGASCTF
jgi:hypothetical protein